VSQFGRRKKREKNKKEQRGEKEKAPVCEADCFVTATAGGGK